MYTDTQPLSEIHQYVYTMLLVINRFSAIHQWI